MRFIPKDAEIVAACSNKRVLHIGCVGFTDLPVSERVALARKSLHYKLTNSAKTIGLDYSEPAIAFLRAQGVFDNVIYGNAEGLEAAQLPSRDFDVIVAADIIEHLSNPGRMLDGIRSLMRPDTLCIITTPNAFGLPNFIRYGLGRFAEGAEHVATYNVQNISNLVARHGLTALSIDTCYQDSSSATPTGLTFKAAEAVLRTFPKFGGTLFLRLQRQ